MNVDIVFIGVGGQGILTATGILGDSAIREGLNVVISEVHGMAQRGGTVEAHVRFGDARGPLIPDGGALAMAAFEPVEALRGARKIARDGTVVVSTAPIYPFTVSLGMEEYPAIREVLAALEGIAGRVVAFDAVETAREAGSVRSVNMAMLGALAATGVLPFSPEVVREGIPARMKDRYLESGLRAFDAGMERAAEATDLPEEKERKVPGERELKKRRATASRESSRP